MTCTYFYFCFILAYHLTSELCHSKTGLEIFVVVIAKVGFAGTSPTKPAFVVTLTIKLYFAVFADYILLSVSDQKKACLGRCQPSLLLVWQNEKNLKTCFNLTSLTSWHTRKTKVLSSKVTFHFNHVFDSIYFCKVCNILETNATTADVQFLF